MRRNKVRQLRESISLSIAELARGAGLAYQTVNFSVGKKMSTESLAAEAPRLRHISLLQFCGVLSVIAFHVGISGAQAGWMAVEMFFVVAGINMAKHLERYSNVRSYAFARVRRLAPEVGVIWCISLICVAAGWHNRGLVLFLWSAPLFLQNFIEPFFDAASVDWFFLVILWFVAALLQLQILVFIFRRYLIRSNIVVVLGVSLTLTVLCQILTAEMLGGLHRNLDYLAADTIFRMPFSHLTAMVIGVMLGLGRLQGINRYFSVIVAMVLGAGLINIYSSHGSLTISSLGYPADMMLNYQYLWGYPLLAVAAASLCAGDDWLAATLVKVTMPVSLERWLDRLAILSYGAYVFHGLILSTARKGLRFSGWYLNSLGEFILFLLIVVGAFFSARLFQRLRASII